MRIPSDKSPFLDAQRASDKKTVESPAKAAESTDAQRASEAAALPSRSLDQTVQSSDAAARELESTVAARLEEVRDQLRAGTYAIDYERLARRMMEDGFGS
jgi:anti-sigma28 factor (negative regulator of flagellin synthesis)